MAGYAGRHYDRDSSLADSALWQSALSAVGYNLPVKRRVLSHLMAQDVSVSGSTLFANAKLECERSIIREQNRAASARENDIL